MGWDLSLDVMMPYVWEILAPFEGMVAMLGVILGATAVIALVRRALVGN